MSIRIAILIVVFSVLAGGQVAAKLSESVNTSAQTRTAQIEEASQ